MKIAQIRDTIYPYTKGGAQKRVWELSKRLASRGHEVHLFGMKYWDGEDVILKNNVYLHGVCEQKKIFVGGRRSIKQAIYFSYKILFPLLKEDFDIIICDALYLHCFSAKICSSLKGTPLVITWHEVWDDYWYEYLGKKGVFGKAVERMTAHLTDKMVAVSERTKKDLERIGVRKEIKVIPNGIDFGEIEMIKASDEESDVIFAGRLIKEKNVDVLIKAVKLVRKEVPDVKCMIIGDGPEKVKLEKISSDLEMDNNIRFMGFLEDYNDVISYMKSSKVFVLPSTREGFGIVAMEANSCGLPVVTVNHKRNAACDFINNGNGFICELSEEDVAEKIVMARDRRKDMERKCIENAKGYDWERIADLVENYYKVNARL